MNETTATATTITNLVKEETKGGNIIVAAQFTFPQEDHLIARKLAERGRIPTLAAHLEAAAQAYVTMVNDVLDGVSPVPTGKPAAKPVPPVTAKPAPRPAKPIPAYQSGSFGASAAEEADDDRLPN